MRDDFKFQLCAETYPQHTHIVFKAKAIDDKYTVTWINNEKTESIDYSKENVKEIVKQGIWIII